MPRISLLVLALAPAAHAQLSWDGDCGQVWDEMCGLVTTSTNWSMDAIPGMNDTCTATGETIVVQSLGNTAQSLMTTGGSFEITNAGELILHAPSSIANATIHGRLFSNAQVMLADGFTLAGSGSVEGSGPFIAPSLTIAGGNVGGANGQAEMTLLNAVTVDLNGNFNIANGCTLEFTGTCTAPGSRGISGSAGAGATFLNNGDLVLNNAGFVDITPTYEQNGTLTVNGGQLSFLSRNAEFLAGTVTLNNGARVRLLETVGGGAAAHRLDGVSQISGDGAFIFGTGGTLTQLIESDVVFDLTPSDTSFGRGLAIQTQVFFDGATLTNRGLASWANSARISMNASPGSLWLNDTGGDLLINSATLAAHFTNLGLVTQSQGTSQDNLRFARGLGLEIVNESEWDILKGSIVRDSQTTGASARFTNKGAFRKPDLAGVTESVIDVPFDQDAGDLTVNRQHLRFRNGGEWTNDSEATVGSGPFAEIRYENGTYSFVGTGHTFGGPGIVTIGPQLFGDAISFDIPTGSTLSFGMTGAALQNGATFDGGGLCNNVGNYTINSAIINTEFQNFASLLIGGGTFTRLINGALSNTSSGNVVQNGDLSLGATGSITNDGLWSINTASIIAPGSTVFDNNGTILVQAVPLEPPEIAVLNIPVDNTGTVRASNGLITFTRPITQLTNGVLSGGTWLVDFQGSILFPEPITEVVAPASVVADNVATPDLVGLEAISGAVLVADSFAPTGPVTVEDSGSLTIQPGATFDGDLENGRSPTDPAGPSTGSSVETEPEGQKRLRGTTPHIISPTFVNYAHLLPGRAGAIGEMRIEGDLQLEPSSTLEIEIDGALHDAVALTGNAVLGGTLDVSFLGAEPTPADRFIVLTHTGAVSGTFDSITHPMLASGLPGTTRFEPGQVVLVFACAADLTTQGAGSGDPGYGLPDGMVSVSDLQFFVNAWIAQDLLIADVTTTGAAIGDPGFGVPDGQVTTGDLQYFVNLWIAGCP